jgi:hypothetical protein
MKDPELHKTAPVVSRTLFLRGFLVLLCLFALTVLTIRLYLNTHHAAAQLSKVLTSYLHQPARIARLSLSGATINLSGISLGNQSDMHAGNLVEIDSVSVTPGWRELVLGSFRFRQIALSGLHLDLRKNKAGNWNFSEIMNRFSSSKSSGSDLFIDKLSLIDSSIQVNGQGVQGISLQLNNLSTKGTRDARVQLSFEDAVHSNYALSGTIRPGDNQLLEMDLTAQTLSFDGMYEMLKQKPPEFIKGVQGGLTLHASLKANLLTVTGNLDVHRPSASSAAAQPPFVGSVRFNADYDTLKDSVNLHTLTVMLKNIVSLQAAGTATGLKKERRFNVTLGLDRIDLARLVTLLPVEERRKTVIGGYVADTTIHISGSATHGITQATGSLLLHDGSLEREGELLIKGLSSRIAISRETDGFRVNGNLFAPHQSTRALLETLDAPFTVSVSNRLRVLKAELPQLSAVVRGLRATGRIGFTPERNNPLDVSLRMSVPNIATLQPFLGNRDARIISGSALLNLDGAGQGASNFSASATAGFTNINVVAGKKIALKNGTINFILTGIKGKQSVAGNASLTGMAYDSKAGDARFAFSFADRVAMLENCRISFDGVTSVLSKISAVISSKEKSPGGYRYPLRVEVAGGNAQRGPAQLKGLSGSAQGWYAADSLNSWLEGAANLSVDNISWQGKPVASPVVKAVVSRSEVSAVITGLLLGGTLSGDVVMLTAAPDLGTTYHLGIKGIQLSQAGAFVPKHLGVLFSSGTVDTAISGGYSRTKGVAGRFDASGVGISIVGNSGKNLLTDAGFSLAGDVSNTSLSISNALFKAGEHVSLKLKGTVKNPLDAQRDGHIDFFLQKAQLTTIIDQFVNSMPRLIQEATAEGSLASEGAVVFHNGSLLLNGTLQFTNVSLDVPSQKLKASDINGSVPFSVDMSGKASFKSADDIDFSRTNFSKLLARMKVDTEQGNILRVGAASFGNINLGEIQLMSAAQGGVTHIVSLRSSLYDGGIYGTGWVFLKNGLNYRSGLLIDGLSLKSFCSTMPEIKDYISGRLDGVLHVTGTGSSLAAINGLTQLWVREDSEEKMLISRIFLQKLSGKKLNGFFFRSDRPFNRAEISANLQKGYLTFDQLDIAHTNMFGVRDLSVSVAPAQNRIALDHLFTAVKQAADRGKAAAGADSSPAQAPLETEFKWQE